MKKLILEEWISLDGYATDKNNQLDFFTGLAHDQNVYSDSDQLKFLETVDTILLGRKTYELFFEFWPNATVEEEVIADRLNELPKIVFSNTITKAPWGKWEDARVISGDSIAAIRELKSQPGKDMVLWGSISLAQALMKADLIDEYHIQVCPILNGGGRSLFAGDLDFTRLNLKETRQYNTGVTYLNYERLK